MPSSVVATAQTIQPAPPGPHYPWGDALPAAGGVLELAPGVYWLRMALPFALDHINLWLLRDHSPDGRDGWTVVDCGIANDATRACWEQLFAEVLQGLPVLRVIVTHMHPDHLGLADWLCRRWSQPEQPCRLWISATDWYVARLARLEPRGFGGEETARFYQRHGVSDAPLLAEVRQRRNHYADMVPAVPDTYCRLQEGMTLRIGGRDWSCLAGYGHAPEHIALFCPSLPQPLLISGDMVLPRISTNISVICSEPEANPLGLFLGCLRQWRARLPANTLVLPSHGKPFVGLHARITELEQHHSDRLADVLTACAQAPQSAAELLPQLFPRPLDGHQIGFALGETIAHVNALLADGRLQATVGADGVLRCVGGDAAG